MRASRYQGCRLEKVWYPRWHGYWHGSVAAAGATLDDLHGLIEKMRVLRRYGLGNEHHHLPSEFGHHPHRRGEILCGGGGGIGITNRFPIATVP
jgi:hypothetical protein